MLIFLGNGNSIQQLFYLSLEEIDFFDISILFLSSLLSYIYLFLKFYRILCFSKIAFDTLPMINPYVWPFSIFRALTQPYFSLWQKILPGIKWGRTSFDVSQILGLEALTLFMYTCGYFHRIVLRLI